MIVKTSNIQVICIYESIFCNIKTIHIIHITLYKKNSSKISKEEEVIHNVIQKQLLTIPKSALNRSICYVLFRKYTFHD